MSLSSIIIEVLICFCFGYFLGWLSVFMADKDQEFNTDKDQEFNKEDEDERN